MIDDLEFLRGEHAKVQKVLGKVKAEDYKRYATLYQVYVALDNAITQKQGFKAREAEEKKRKEEEERILKEAQKEIQEENKKSKKNK